MTAELHIRPNGDLIEHLDNDCPCGPESRPIKRDDGSVGWLIVHHSLDGREQHEGTEETNGEH